MFPESESHVKHAAHARALSVRTELMMVTALRTLDSNGYSIQRESRASSDATIAKESSNSKLAAFICSMTSNTFNVVHLLICNAAVLTVHNFGTFAFFIYCNILYQMPQLHLREPLENLSLRSVK